MNFTTKEKELFSTVCHQFYITSLDRKYLIFTIAFRQDFIQMITIRISNEYLSEVITRNKLDNRFYSLRIQFVKDIV